MAAPQARTVFLRDRKTSVRLEPVMWEALRDIAHDNGVTVNDLVDRIDRNREGDEGLTAAIRVHIVAFYLRKCAELEAKG
jgi:predicted DNA-binding ribbon-helix-helix protein